MLAQDIVLVGIRPKQVNIAGKHMFLDNVVQRIRCEDFSKFLLRHLVGLKFAHASYYTATQSGVGFREADVIVAANREPVRAVGLTGDEEKLHRLRLHNRLDLAPLNHFSRL